MLGKLLSIASIGNAIAGASLTRKFVSDLVVVVAMSIVAAILSGGLVIACLIEIRALLENYGVDRHLATADTLLLAFSLVLLISLCINRRIRTMHSPSSPLGESGDAVTSTVHSVIRGFYRGLTAPLPPKTTYTPK